MSANPTTSLSSRLLAFTPKFLHPYWDRVKASPVGYRLAHGVFWTLTGTVVARVLGLGSSILVARLIGKVGVGELGMIQSTVGMFTAFAGLGMGLTATKYVSEYRVTDPRRAGEIISLSSAIAWVTGGAMTLVVFLLAPWFAQHTLAAPQLTNQVRIGSLLLLLGGVNGTQTGALSGFEAFKTIARVTFLTGIAYFALMVCGALWLGLTGAVIGFVGATGVNTVLNWFALRAEMRRAGIPRQFWPRQLDWALLWNFSAPSFLSGLILGPVNWATSAMLVNRPGGYGEMGLFNAANNWYNALMFLPGVLGQVVLPLLSSTAVDSDHRRPLRLVLISTKTNALILLPAVLLLSLVSPLVMGAYGPGFREGWLTLVLMAGTATIHAIQNPTVQWIIARGRMWTVLFLYLAWGISFIGLTYLLIGNPLAWGSKGLASARLLAVLLSGILAAWIAVRMARTDAVECPQTVPAPC